jgi:hypothetical protein
MYYAILLYMVASWLSKTYPANQFGEVKDDG